MAETTRHFVSRVYAVKEGKVLLIKGKKGQWLPPGGHVKMDELPTQTAVREVMEETGQKIVLMSTENKRIGSTHILPQPDHMEVHDISGDHQHIAFIYFAEIGEKPKGGTKDGSRETRWFTPEEIDAETMRDSIKFFAKKAIKDLSPKKEPEQPPVKEKKSVFSKMKEGAEKMTGKAKGKLKRGGEKSPEQILEEQKSELGPEEGQEKEKKGKEETGKETPEKEGEK